MMSFNSKQPNRIGTILILPREEVGQSLLVAQDHSQEKVGASP
jgi:hypothetical protein